jgi:inner membrane protein
VLILSAACAAAPDLDLVGWALRIPNESVFGHRSITHSLAAAMLLGVIATWLALHGDTGADRSRGRRARLFAMFAGASASHGVFDAMTTYSLGVAFLAPFSLHRFRFDWQPLTDPFRDGRLSRGIGDELLWVLLPATVAAFAGLRLRPARRTTRRITQDGSS